MQATEAVSVFARIVITDLKGKYLDQIGGNGPALRDGSFESAALNRPQGLAYSAARECLYIADTENHALREVGPTGLRGGILLLCCAAVVPVALVKEGAPVPSSCTLSCIAG